jgi:redox-sensitive bicupin YhaK (pirin superfamily)
MPERDAGACIRRPAGRGKVDVMPSTHLGPEPALERVWARLAPRLARSATQSRRHLSRRRADMACRTEGGAQVRVVHQVGEAERLRWVDLPAGARFELPLQPGGGFAALVCEGEVRVGGERCGPFDYREGGARAELSLSSVGGARLLLHEHAAASDTGLVAPNPMPWQTLAPGLSLRLLAWPGDGGVAPFLLRLDAGSTIPPHRHRHDEWCLLLEGEMHSEDLLLLPGDFQLARAGGLHREVASEGGALLYIHGDVEPELVAAAAVAD